MKSSVTFSENLPTLSASGIHTRSCFFDYGKHVFFSIKWQFIKIESAVDTKPHLPFGYTPATKKQSRETVAQNSRLSTWLGYFDFVQAAGYP